MKIDFGQFIHALSDTVDLVGVDEVLHSKRVAYVALECARLLGGGKAEQLLLYRAGLLHDCGVSSTQVHKKLVNELEWTNSSHHCQIGAQRMKRFAPLSVFSEIIYYHHTRWEQLKDLSLSEESKTYANLIFLADRVDALAGMAQTANRLICRDAICNKVQSLQGSYFKPELVEVFLAAAEKEAFWITQEPDHLRDYLHMQIQETDPLLLDISELKSLACIFAEIVDAKSPYTAEHSFGVTKLAMYLARRCKLPEATVRKIEVAGLLHDLGKLQVPDSILDYKGGLEGEDLTVMRHHSYVTFMILSKIGGLEEITRWAADHHEKLDGSGYPFKKSENDLSIESRIIMIADIFQALAQNRPYRSSLPPSNIIEIIGEQVKSGLLDREVFKIVEVDPDQCYQEALNQMKDSAR